MNASKTGFENDCFAYFAFPLWGDFNRERKNQQLTERVDRVASSSLSPTSQMCDLSAQLILSGQSLSMKVLPPLQLQPDEPSPLPWPVTRDYPNVFGYQFYTCTDEQGIVWVLNAQGFWMHRDPAGVWWGRDAQGFWMRQDRDCVWWKLDAQGWRQV